jgi:Zn finger protein HypA/HybF involved in hydrogenase expression
MTQASQTPPYDPALEGTPRDFKCLTCQLVFRARYLPRFCPRCGASRVKMVELRAGAVVEEEA